jgi:hypothetical protein
LERIAAAAVAAIQFGLSRHLLEFHSHVLLQGQIVLLFILLPPGACCSFTAIIIGRPPPRPAAAFWSPLVVVGSGTTPLKISSVTKFHQLGLVGFGARTVSCGRIIMDMARIFFGSSFRPVLSRCPRAFGVGIEHY